MSSRRPSKPSRRSDRATRLVLVRLPSLRNGLPLFDRKVVGFAALLGLLLYGVLLAGFLTRSALLGSELDASTLRSKVSRPSSGSPFSDGRLQPLPWQPRIGSITKLNEHEDFEWVKLDGGRSDLIVVGHGPVWTTLRRICVATGREIWTRRFPSTIQTKTGGEAPISIWKSEPSVVNRVRQRTRTNLIQPAPDLNGDGTGDLVWCAHEQADGPIIAISGDAGKLIWIIAEPAGRGGRISSQPLIADANHDGSDDVVVCASPQNGVPWIEVILGNNGRRLWRQHLDDCVTGPTRTNMSPLQKDTSHLVDLVQIDGQTLVAVEGDSQISFHSVECGLPIAKTISPPGTRSRAACFADFDGDGESESILIRKHNTRELVNGFPPFTISAWQTANGCELWRQQLSCAIAARQQSGQMTPLTDVDHDHRLELAISNYARSNLTIDLVDAESCQSRWPRDHRLSRNPEALVGQILQCPDMDGDAMDDLIVVTIDHLKRTQSRSAIFLDVLSGHDGESIATMCRPLSGSGEKRLEIARWLPQRDRSPLLAMVTSQTSHHKLVINENRKCVDIWSLGSRELVCSIDEIDRVQFCDVEGNGIQSLCISREGFAGPALSVLDFRSSQETVSWSTQVRDDRQLALSYLTEPEYCVLDAGSDPRWLQPLPWSTMLTRTIDEIAGAGSHRILGQMEYFALALFACVGIFVAPGWLGFRLIVDGRWSLGRWLLLPAVASVAITSFSMFGGHHQTQTIAILCGLPVLIVTLLVPALSWTAFLLPIEVVALMLRRHYDTIAVLLSVATLLSIIAASAWLLPIWSQMDEDFRFDWAHWHWIWLAAAYVTGWGYLLAISILKLANRNFSS